jgi:hypothetical protein
MLGQWPAFGPVHWLILTIVVAMIVGRGMIDRR